MAINSSTSTSYQYDTSSGQDAAYKAAQERSNLQAQGQSALYSGNIPDLLASANRIRDLQKYLSAYGSDPNGFEVIPQTRMSGFTKQTHDSQSMRDYD